MVNTSDSGSRGRGFEPHSGCRVVFLSKTYLPPKVLAIPRKWWLRPNMTEKLFTGTLRIKPNQNQIYPANLFNVGILIFMSRINFMFSRVEREKNLYHLGSRYGMNLIIFIIKGCF